MKKLLLLSLVILSLNSEYALSSTKILTVELDGEGAGADYNFPDESGAKEAAIENAHISLNADLREKAEKAEDLECPDGYDAGEVFTNDYSLTNLEEEAEASMGVEGLLEACILHSINANYKNVNNTGWKYHLSREDAIKDYCSVDLLDSFKWHAFAEVSLTQKWKRVCTLQPDKNEEGPEDKKQFDGVGSPIAKVNLR
jgi:hypothetical protein